MKKQEETTGMSQRAYAKRVGVHPSYIGKLVREHKIPANPDGSIDPATADAARERNTLQGRGQRKWQKRHPAPVKPVTAAMALECSACKCRYRRETSARTATPDPDRFCCSDCQADTEQGLSAKQIRRRRERGIPNPHAARPERPVWTPPPPRPRDIRTCFQCGGTYDFLEREPRWDAKDRLRFCDKHCEGDFFAGVDRTSTQQRIRVGVSGEYRDSEEIRTKSYLNYAQ